MNPRLKRAYDRPAASDGLRVLVDRVWPRGLKKQDAQIDLWLREIAPSTGLRKWFGHDPRKWDAFQKRYSEELDEKGECVVQLRELLERGNVTLLFGAKDEAHNNAVALQAYLSRKR